MAKTDLQKIEPAGALAVPDFMKGDAGKGLEHLKKDDLQLPRLALAQGLSPQLVDGNAKYIEDLKLGDMFNNLTGDIYGKGPLTFAVVRADPPRGIEFNPLNEGGGVKSFNVPLDDPRMLFGPNGEKPLATKFYDFVIAFLPSRTLIALSLKSSQLKVARQLNTLMKLRANVPVYGGLYTLASVQQTNRKGTFAGFTVKNAGNVQDEDSYTWLKKTNADLAGKTIVIDREDTADDAVSDEM